LTALFKFRLFRIYFIKNRPSVGFFMPKIYYAERCCLGIIFRIYTALSALFAPVT